MYKRQAWRNLQRHRAIQGRHIHSATEGCIRWEQHQLVEHPQTINPQAVIGHDPELQEMITAARGNALKPQTPAITSKGGRVQLDNGAVIERQFPRFPGEPDPE